MSRERRARVLVNMNFDVSSTSKENRLADKNHDLNNIK